MSKNCAPNIDSAKIYGTMKIYLNAIELTFTRDDRVYTKFVNADLKSSLYMAPPLAANALPDI